jgi:hypothetical protein
MHAVAPSENGFGASRLVRDAEQSPGALLTLSDLKVGEIDFDPMRHTQRLSENKKLINQQFSVAPGRVEQLKKPIHAHRI